MQTIGRDTLGEQTWLWKIPVITVFQWQFPAMGPFSITGGVPTQHLSAPDLNVSWSDPTASLDGRGHVATCWNHQIYERFKVQIMVSPLLHLTSWSVCRFCYVTGAPVSQEFRICQASTIKKKNVGNKTWVKRFQTHHMSEPKHCIYGMVSHHEWFSENTGYNGGMTIPFDG